MPAKSSFSVGDQFEFCGRQFTVMEVGGTLKLKEEKTNLTRLLSSSILRSSLQSGTARMLEKV